MQNNGLGVSPVVDPIDAILDTLEGPQYKSDFLKKRAEIMKTITTLPFTTRADLQKLGSQIPAGSLISKTSGSTGIPVIVPRTQESMLWARLTNTRELRWRKWDLTRKSAVVMLAGNEKDTIKGNIHSLKMRTISEFQMYLYNVQPNYLYTYPSIIASLNLSLIPSLIDIKSVGETGGTNYSSEETGTIALQCPEYPENGYHIMENIIVENHPEHGAVITDLSNPCVVRYIIGDEIELQPENFVCPCGRILPMIKKIYGRRRNMLILPGKDGGLDKIWPVVGEPKFRSHISQKIIRHRVVQKTLTELEIQVECESGKCLDKDEKEKLSALVLDTLGYDHLTCSVVETNFALGKFEAFISEVETLGPDGSKFERENRRSVCSFLKA